MSEPMEKTKKKKMKSKPKHRNKSRHLKVRQVTTYDPDFKKAVILCAEEKSTREAKKLYGVSESNIRRWKKMKNDIYEKSEQKRTLSVERRRSTRNVDRSSSSLLELVDVQEVDPLECVENYNSRDSMPLQQRITQSGPSTEEAPKAVLQSQPLSPTKLKVTRQSVKAASTPPAPAPAPKPEPPKEPPNEEVCLRWNSHHSNMQTAFPNLLLREQYVDVTLIAEGQTLKCHRLILSSCSPYFEELLQGITPHQHPVFFMRDIPFWILKSLCDYMYAGEIHIYQNKLEELLAVADALKIKGLARQTPPAEETDRKPKEESKSKETKVNEPFESTSKYDKDNDDEIDPLDLLEPLYEEVEEKKPPPPLVKPKEIKPSPVKKTVPKKVKKRKYAEHDHDPSPPPVFHLRKGTRSRPNVKIPKYYHSDYDQASKSSPSAEQASTSQMGDPLLQADEIKSEPVDMEDNVIIFNDDEPLMSSSTHDDESIMGSYDSPIVNPLDEVDNNSGDVEVVEHSLADQELMDGALFNTDSNQAIEVTKVTGKNGSDDRDDEETSEGFKKISLMPQPIIMEVRSLTNEIDKDEEITEANNESVETEEGKISQDNASTEAAANDSDLNIGSDPYKPSTEAEMNIRPDELISSANLEEPLSPKEDKADSKPTADLDGDKLIAEIDKELNEPGSTHGSDEKMPPVLEPVGHAEESLEIPAETPNTRRDVDAFDDDSGQEKVNSVEDDVINEIEKTIQMLNVISNSNKVSMKESSGGEESEFTVGDRVEENEFCMNEEPQAEPAGNQSSLNDVQAQVGGNTEESQSNSEVRLGTETSESEHHNDFLANT